MIFVTTGTEKFPFDRLLKIIDEALQNKGIEKDIFAQVGNSNYKPRLFAYKDYIEFDEMAKIIQESDIVISHAGVGSILLCLSLGKIPILFPRNATFGEHLDNHQIDFARKIDSLGKALVAYDENELIYNIKHYNKLLELLKPCVFYRSKEKLINYLSNICKSKVK